jgi:ABC-type nickel/cobalt efflux system permease component RcnA
MNFFGIISLLMVLGVAVWWLGQGIEGFQTDESDSGTHAESIDAAHAVAEALSQ